MALVLKIAIVSAVLAAAFVYGSEHGTTAGRPGPARVSVGAPAGSAATDELGSGVRVISLAARGPA